MAEYNGSGQPDEGQDYQYDPNARFKTMNGQVPPTPGWGSSTLPPTGAGGPPPPPPQANPMAGTVNFNPLGNPFDKMRSTGGQA